MILPFPKRCLFDTIVNVHHKTFELLNHPTSVRICVKVKNTCVVVGTSLTLGDINFSTTSRLISASISVKEYLQFTSASSPGIAPNLTSSIEYEPWVFVPQQQSFSIVKSFHLKCSIGCCFTRTRFVLVLFQYHLSIKSPDIFI